MKKLRSFRTKVVAVTMAILLALFSVSFSTNHVSAENANEAMTYNTYSQSGTKTSSYTLSSLSTLSSASTREIVDTEDRVVDNTKSAVVKIITTSGGIGSGFIVDDNVIATAAHCVYGKTANSTKNSVKISKILVFDSSGNVTKTITSINEVHVPQTYISMGGSGSNGYDYAMVTVDEDLSDYASFGLGVMQDGIINAGATVYSTGFPGVINNTETVNTTTQHQKYTGTGTVFSVTAYDSERQFCVTNDITGGDSGGPVYVKTTFQNKTYYTVIGITTASATGHNVANRISPTLLQFYKNNSNI